MTAIMYTEDNIKFKMLTYKNASKLNDLEAKISIKIEELNVYKDDYGDYVVNSNHFGNALQSENNELFEILSSVNKVKITINKNVDVWNTVFEYLEITFSKKYVTVNLTDRCAVEIIYDTIKIRKDKTSDRNCYLCACDFDTESDDTHIYRNTCCINYCCIECFKTLEYTGRCVNCKKLLNRR